MHTLSCVLWGRGASFGTGAIVAEADQTKFSVSSEDDPGMAWGVTSRGENVDFSVEGFISLPLGVQGADIASQGLVEKAVGDDGNTDASFGVCEPSRSRLSESVWSQGLDGLRLIQL